MERHDLHHEFPQYEKKIHDLKVSNSHFKTLFDEYHAINKEIHGYENGGISTTDEHLHELRTKRVYLKDELFELLKN